MGEDERRRDLPETFSLAEDGDRGRQSVASFEMKFQALDQR